MLRPAKRILDLLISFPAVLILLPVFAAIIIAIRVNSKGAAVFKQQRAGKDGKPFTFYKFRTMKVYVDPFGSSPKSGDDPRLTRIGKLLREYSLDELPQLFNILKGDMNIVGPRPLYISQMAEWNERQKKRLLVKPGLTGLAQISGRGELTREEKLELDVKYVETASFWTDIKIILTTAIQVFRRKSIYEKRYSQTEYTRRENSNRE
ncbi:MAG: sugar transferase [Planctomycetota bacterium]|jgi:lipopolysaccharide/colanic/teichoic acid biosynthesis glycosyltransferase